MIVAEKVDFSFLNADDRSSYFKHPTFSYRGNHENFIVGLLGEAKVTIKGKERESSIMNNMKNMVGMGADMPYANKQ